MLSYVYVSSPSQDSRLSEPVGPSTISWENQSKDIPRPISSLIVGPKEDFTNRKSFQWPAPNDIADGLSRYGMPNNLWTALTCATLAGSVIGQVTFGVLGDLFGRVKMYGILLIMILWATVGLAAAADGSHRSMSIVGWLFFWRFFVCLSALISVYSATSLEPRTSGSGSTGIPSSWHHAQRATLNQTAY